MSDRYDKTAANHYSAYRPPLHKIILDCVLSKEQIFTTGADIGCGTGYSAVALAKYCSNVYGIEPSKPMLDEAEPHKQITYLLGSSNKLPISEDSLDIVTFAGSLFYAKSKFLIKELKRVCNNQAFIIPYDFEVLLDTVFMQLGLQSKSTVFDYDYKVNFSADKDFEEIYVRKKQITFPLKTSELAHILLCEPHHYQNFREKYDKRDPFPILVEELEQIGSQHELNANVYFSKYRINDL